MQRDAVQKKDTVQVLVFSLSNEELALDISCVREVLRAQEIHPLPQAPDFIEGVINVRKRIIAVIDLRKKLGVELTKDIPGTNIIICKLKNFITGLIVDKVIEVLSFPKSDIQPVPQIVSAHKESGHMSGIAQIGTRMITIIDLEKILTCDEIHSFSDIEK